MTARSRKPQPVPSRTLLTEHTPDLKTAFEVIYREQSRNVWFTLRRLGVPERHLGDALHDVFLVVLRRLPEYEERDRLLGWLTAIAKNVAMDYRKNESKHALASELDMQQPDPSHDSEPATTALDRARLLLTAIKDPERRDVFIRHQIEGETILEIARALDIPEGTVHSRLLVARQDVQAAEKRLRAQEQRHEGAIVLPLFSATDAQHDIPPMPDGLADAVWIRLQRSPEYKQAFGSEGGGSDDDHGGKAEGIEGGARIGHGAAALLLVGGIGGTVLGLALGARWNALHPSPHLETRPDALALAPAALAAPSAAPPPPMSSSTVQPRDPTPSASSFLRSASSNTKVQEHTQTYSTGRLAEERDAIWISALIHAGRLNEARERLDRFAEHYPASARLDGLRNTLPPSL